MRCLPRQAALVVEDQSPISAQAPLPPQHANLVQYADCQIDTTTQIYFESARRTGRTYAPRQPKAQQAFMKYAHQQTDQPTFTYSDKQTAASWWEAAARTTARADTP